MPPLTLFLSHPSHIKQWASSSSSLVISETMKFEDLLMQQSEEKLAKLQLQDQVERLQQELDGELKLNRVLRCAVEGPVGCCDPCACLSPLLPFKVQVLLAELAVVEDEIEWLETKVGELKSGIDKEKQQIREWEALDATGVHPQLSKLASRRPGSDDRETTPQYGRQNVGRHRRASIGSSMELQRIEGKQEAEEEIGNSRCSTSRVIHMQPDTDFEMVNPNKLSVELIKCLTGVFLKLNQRPVKSKGTSGNLTKHTLTCMNSGLVSKAAFSCRTPVFPVNQSVSHLDPYEILQEPDHVSTLRDIGPYKNFIWTTRNTLDTRRLPECLPAMRRLMILMQKLGKISLSHFTHKQKLAFWINVYNAAIMNAFLQHGLPSTQEKLLTLVHEAAINVSGYMLKASTIEHFILRHPAENKHELTEEEVLMRQVCGLDYPEPNITFALCRGSWSSPAVRYYTEDEVMNELEKAKAEYLEASVGITSRKKILVPKLMRLHMKDFADDMESLVEWIYSQLPCMSPLKRMMVECLNGEARLLVPRKLVEVQPYAADFRYLIPM